MTRQFGKKSQEQMSKHKYVMRVFVCPVCGRKLLFSKSVRNRTSPGHIKTAYCPYCRETRDFIQHSEFDFKLEG